MVADRVRSDPFPFKYLKHVVYISNPWVIRLEGRLEGRSVLRVIKVYKVGDLTENSPPRGQDLVSLTGNDANNLFRVVFVFIFNDSVYCVTNCLLSDWRYGWFSGDAIGDRGG